MTKLGIVGLPNVGESTLFNPPTKAGAESANYPFCIIDPNVGVVPVPDERPKLLGDLYHSKKVTPAMIEFVDVTDLVKGASKGEGLGNQLLSNVRKAGAIVHVVRCFEDINVIHVDGNVDPLRDIETTDLGLIFSNIGTLGRRIVKTAKAANNDKSLTEELVVLRDMKAHLEDGKLVHSLEGGDKGAISFINNLNLLAREPAILAANASEDDLVGDGKNDPYVQEVRKFAGEDTSQAFIAYVQIEQEIAELGEDEKKMPLGELGLKEFGLEKLIAASYKLPDLISYLTSEEDEIRAWAIEVGTKVPQAAGKIHTDFEHRFIRAEAVNYRDLLDCKTYPAVEEKGLVRLEGKNCVAKNGDITLSRPNV